MRRAIIATLAWPAALLAQLDSELAPREIERPPESKLPFEVRPVDADPPADDSAVLVGHLRTITLRAGDLGPVTRISVSHLGSIDLHGVTVDGSGLGDALLGFLGRPLTANGLDRMIDTVLRHYEANDRPVTDVTAPAQDLASGTILLECVEGRVGTVGLETGAVFNDKLLGGAVRVRGGEPLLASDLQSHLDWFNRNPFRPASLYAAPGQGEGEADLVFAFAEQRPWRVYTAYENSGSEAAGENRFLLGANWGNAFGLDQLLNYQFTMGGSYEELHAHAASWEIPIHPWHHYLRLSGAFAEIRTETASAGQHVAQTGTNWQLGGVYGIQLPRWNDFKQEVSFGAEFKSSDNFLVFGGEDAHPGTVVEVVQFRADYRATRRSDRNALEVHASLAGGPGGLSGRNTDEDFALFREGADASYLYARAKATWVQRLPSGWSLRATAEAQIASGALLPTEQLGLGGHASVRGYEERAFLADHGYALSAEVRAPAIDLPAGKLPDAQIQLLGFIDHGLGWRDETMPGEEAAQRFLGVGIGARARAGSHLSLRTDLGLPLIDDSGLRGHIGVTVAF